MDATKTDFRLAFPAHTVRMALDNAYDRWASRRIGRQPHGEIHPKGLAILRDLLPKFSSYGVEVAEAAQGNPDLREHSRLVGSALSQWNRTIESKKAGEFVTLLVQVKESERELYR
jgi:hypothetical protein